MPAAVRWEIVDLADGQAYPIIDSAPRLTQGGHLEASPTAAALHVTIDSTPQGGATSIHVRLENRSNDDRGLVVRLTLDLPPGSWRYWHDPDTPEALGPQLLSDTEALRELPGLPEFSQGPRPDFGRYSVYPVGVVDDGSGWIAVARPVVESALMRFQARGGGRAALIAEVDLALPGKSTSPMQADAMFLLMTGSSSPDTPMRDALDRYHAGQATFLAPRTAVFGGWMPPGDLSGIPNVDEFGFAYHEGDNDVPFDDRLGVLSFLYFSAAGEFVNVPPGRAKRTAEPPYDRVVKAFNQVASERSGVADVWDPCGTRGPDGRIAYSDGGSYGDYFSQPCLDPALPYGRAMTDQLVKRVSARPSPAGIDGCYLDGLAAGLDYSADHLKTARHLFLWDPSPGRLVNYNLFSSAEWLRGLHDRLTGTGKLIMLNDASLTAFPFVMPFVDVFGAELGLAMDRPTARRLRFTAARRPCCTLAKADFTTISTGEIESYMRRCVAYAILPGFFDVSPSGAHPGTSYWLHPEWYDRDRALFRRYLPLARELAAAGWEPKTGASVTGDGAWIERFGRSGDGLRYLTVSTDPRIGPDIPATVHVQFGKPAGGPTGGSGAIAVELLTGRIASASDDVAVEMSGEDLAVWAVGTPQAQAKGYLARAGDLLARREAYLLARADRKELLAPWVRYDPDEDSELVAPGRIGGTSLRVDRKSGDAPGGVYQTVVPDGGSARPMIVSAWSRAEQVTGEADLDYSIYVDCHYEDGTALYGSSAPFRPGTHDWELAQVRIEPTQPVKDISAYLLLRGQHLGSAWFDDVSVAWADAPEKNLLERGGFEDTGSSGFLAGTDAAARSAADAAHGLAALLSAAPEAMKWDDASRLCDSWEAAIPAGDSDPDAVRSRRDVADLRWDLSQAGRCLEGKAVPGSRSSRLTPPAVLGSQH